MWSSKLSLRLLSLVGSLISWSKPLDLTISKYFAEKLLFFIKSMLKIPLFITWYDFEARIFNSLSKFFMKKNLSDLGWLYTTIRRKVVSKNFNKLWCIRLNWMLVHLNFSLCLCIVPLHLRISSWVFVAHLGDGGEGGFNRENILQLQQFLTRYNEMKPENDLPKVLQIYYRTFITCF